MASSGLILLGNHVVNRIEGSMATSALTCNPNVYPIGLDPIVHGRHTLGTTLGGCILECTHVRGPVPSFITGHSQDFHLGSQTATAYGNHT